MATQADLERFFKKKVDDKLPAPDKKEVFRDAQADIQKEKPKRPRSNSAGKRSRKPTAKRGANGSNSKNTGKPTA